MTSTYLSRISAGSAEAWATDTHNQPSSPIAAGLTTPDVHLDEMWLAYKEAMTEPSPPRSAKPRPIPHRPGLVTNPTWSEKTDTFTRVTPKTLYFGNVALAKWRTDFVE